ncbi:MAG: BA14K family protein [Hyphomicrobiaceae bacterium]
MMRTASLLRGTIAASAFAAAVALNATVAAAAPAVAPAALQNQLAEKPTTDNLVTQVRGGRGHHGGGGHWRGGGGRGHWRGGGGGRYWRGGGWGGYGGYYYRPRYRNYYYPYYGYYYPPVVSYYYTRPYRYRRYWARDAIERCADRFRSFNRRTGTYITYGGVERLCPYLRY